MQRPSKADRNGGVTAPFFPARFCANDRRLLSSQITPRVARRVVATRDRLGPNQDDILGQTRVIILVTPSIHAVSWVVICAAK